MRYEIRFTGAARHIFLFFSAVRKRMNCNWSWHWSRMSSCNYSRLFGACRIMTIADSSALLLSLPFRFVLSAHQFYRSCAYLVTDKCLFRQLKCFFLYLKTKKNSAIKTCACAQRNYFVRRLWWPRWPLSTCGATHSLSFRAHHFLIFGFCKSRPRRSYSTQTNCDDLSFATRACNGVRSQPLRKKKKIKNAFNFFNRHAH